MATVCRMAKLRNVAYNLSLLLALAAAAGCGKPGAPPPGAPSDVQAPTIEQGTDSAAKDPGAGTTESSPAGTPSEDKGETK
jgi:hypothetical protein